jgi:hypothetical protein
MDVKIKDVLDSRSLCLHHILLMAVDYIYAHMMDMELKMFVAYSFGCVNCGTMKMLI